MSLRLRLALVLVLVNGVVLSTLALWTGDLERLALEEQQRRAVRLQTEVAKLVQFGFEAEDVGDLGRMLSWPLWREFEDAIILDSRVSVMRDGGVVPIGTFLNPRGSRSRSVDFPMQEITRTVARAAREGRNLPVAGGLAIPLSAIGGDAADVWGGVFVRLYAPEVPLDLTGRLLLLGLLATVGGLVLVFLLVDRSVVKPVLDLARAAHVFGDGGSPELQPAPSREVRDLQQAFSSMMQRIRGFQDELEREVRLATERAGDAERYAARQERLAAMGVLAAGLAHEINSPLAGALHSLEVLRRESSGARGQQYGALVQEALERIRELVQRLLRMAPQHVEGGSCRLEDVVADLRAFVASRLEHHDLQIELPADGLAVRGASADVFPVLLNLLQNALDSVEGIGGEGRGEAGKLLLRGERCEDGGARITVRDNGPGAPPELLAHLFEPFVTSKDPGQGTGLGLALAHAVARQLGGSIEASNRSEGGFEVVLQLPPPDEDGPAARQ